jgi:hypothetical protein
MVFKKSKNLLGCPLGPEVRRKSKRRVEDPPTLNGQFFVGLFLENRQFFEKALQIPKTEGAFNSTKI